MPKHTFGVKLYDDDRTELELSVEKPKSVDDDLWDELVSSKDDINELAFQNWVIKAQAGIRGTKSKPNALSKEAAEAYLEGYRYGAGSRGRTAPALSDEDVEEGGFTPEQLALLRKKGVKTA